MTELLIALGVFIVTFLLGSIPWGLIISKSVYHFDIRKVGSGNIGTTNAMRSMGNKGGVAVFLLDFGKGLLSGFIGLLACWYLMPGGGLFGDGTVAAYAVQPINYHSILAIATMGATLGHIFSPWLGFKGGKGIATAIGALFVAFGPIGACIELFAIFAVLVVLTRYVSVGSIASAALCPVVSLYFMQGDPVGIACCTITGALVVWAHRENIGRLLHGNERRIGDKKKPSEA